MMRISSLALFWIILAPSFSLAKDFAANPGDEITRAFHRLLVADAAFITDNNDSAATWLPNESVGANWLVRNSTFAVMTPSTPHRQIAITGFANTSQSNSTSAGVAGAGYCDNEEVSCRAFYGDVQFEKILYGYGMELALKNKTHREVIVTPNSTENIGGTFGIQMSGTGDPAYGGAANASVSTGLLFVGSQPYSFLRGIVFRANSLSGATATTGSAPAVEMARTHTVQWENQEKNAASLGAEGDHDTVNIVAKPAGKKGKLKTPRLNISDIPTSPEGLVSGDIWRKGDTLKIVP